MSVSASLRLALGALCCVLVACDPAKESESNDGGTNASKDDGGPGSLLPIDYPDGQAPGDKPPPVDGGDAGGKPLSDGGPAQSDAGAAPGDSGASETDAGTCANTTNDSSNCGACGYACVNGRSCVASRCTPAWQPISETDAPDPRNGHAAVALAGEYVVTGGTLAAGGAGPSIATAGRYDPTTDTWHDFPTLAAARCGHAAVTTKPDPAGTDEYVLTFGGLTDCSNGTTIGPGLEVSENGDAWQTVSVTGEPTTRYSFGAVALTRAGFGADLFIYGGSTNVDPAITSGAFFALALDGAAAKWTAADCSLTDCDRGGHFSLFVDEDKIRVWGGGPYGNAPAGLQYSGSAMSWSAWTLPAGTPTLPLRFADDGRRIYFLNPQNSACPSGVEVLIYDREASSWQDPDSAEAPAGLLAQAAAAWVGSEMIAWSGNCGSGTSSVGGRYQPPAP